MSWIGMSVLEIKGYVYKVNTNKIFKRNIWVRLNYGECWLGSITKVSSYSVILKSYFVTQINKILIRFTM